MPREFDMESLKRSNVKASKLYCHSDCEKECDGNCIKWVNYDNTEPEQGGYFTICQYLTDREKESLERTKDDKESG